MALPLRYFIDIKKNATERGSGAIRCLSESGNG